MSIPLWAHAYDNYILTETLLQKIGKKLKKKTEKKTEKKPKTNPSQATYAAKLKKKAEGTNPAEIIEALKQGRNKGASSTKRGRRYQSIIVLPVEEMSEEDLKYVLDYASDSEDIEMDGQNYMMGDVRPELYKLLTVSYTHLPLPTILLV